MRPRRGANEPTHGFIFATGIECSYPTIEGGRWRRDEMQATGHYQHWRDDLEPRARVGLTPPPLRPAAAPDLTGPGRYDWDFIDRRPWRDASIWARADRRSLPLRRADWLGNFQNPEVPRASPNMPRAFAERYPWVRFYTPVNEMYVCAQLQRARRRVERAAARRARLRHAPCATSRKASNPDDARRSSPVRPDAIFINSESSEFCQSCCPDPRSSASPTSRTSAGSCRSTCSTRTPARPHMRAYLRDTA